MENVPAAKECRGVFKPLAMCSKELRKRHNCCSQCDIWLWVNFSREDLRALVYSSESSISFAEINKAPMMTTQIPNKLAEYKESRTTRAQTQTRVVMRVQKLNKGINGTRRLHIRYSMTGDSITETR
jgi:hypothetical protein